MSDHVGRISFEGLTPNEQKAFVRMHPSLLSFVFGQSCSSLSRTKVKDSLLVSFPNLSERDRLWASDIWRMLKQGKADHLGLPEELGCASLQTMDEVTLWLRGYSDFDYFTFYCGAPSERTHRSWVTSHSWVVRFTTPTGISFELEAWYSILFKNTVVQMKFLSGGESDGHALARQLKSFFDPFLERERDERRRRKEESDRGFGVSNKPYQGTYYHGARSYYQSSEAIWLQLELWKVHQWMEASSPNRDTIGKFLDAVLEPVLGLEGEYTIAEKG